jgi:hypothetical protein
MADDFERLNLEIEICIRCGKEADDGIYVRAKDHEGVWAPRPICRPCYPEWKRENRPPEVSP